MRIGYEDDAPGVSETDRYCQWHASTNPRLWLSLRFSNFDGDFHCEKHDFLSHKSVLYVLQITDGYLNETYVVSQLTAAIKMIWDYGNLFLSQRLGILLK